MKSKVQCSLLKPTVIIPPITIFRSPTTREELQQFLLDGVLVKAVVDLEREIMAVGGSLHADEEQLLLDDGSEQQNLWGINLYLDDTSDDWIEFDSMINIRPSQNNRSRSVEDPAIQDRIRALVLTLVP